MNQLTETTPVDGIFLADIVDGLTKTQKTIPCKYLYDQRGSKLFDQICHLDEYYLTRSELQIMQRHGQAMAQQLGQRIMLVEYGSGSSVKSRMLLDALEEPVAYVPVDISKEHLLQTADRLRIAYPKTQILPVVADFTFPFVLLKSDIEPSHIALYFPGSTIGNFTMQQAGKLLQFMATMLGPKGGLLIGIDLQKDPAVIEAAYNDSEGVTADFNLNLLRRINSQLDCDFDLANFQHQAIYNSVEHRIEISLLSLRDQVARLGEHEISLHAGEEILSEYSHKYTVDGFTQIAAEFGFSLHSYWTDDRDYFGVLHLVLD